MTKFKVGDKVRVRKNLRTNAFYGRTNFISEMNRMKGQIVTIKNMSSDGKSFMIEEFDYYWSPEMLEPVKEDNPLLKENNAVLTPHSAALTKESSIEMSSMTASGILAICEGKKWNHVANPDVFNS